MTDQPRWFTQTKPGHSDWYIQRFRTMAREGADLEGEARMLDALAERGSRILDAGCGPGRLTGALHRRGHTCVGVDVDPALIEAARVDHPGPAYHVADLASLDLAAIDGAWEPVDLVVCAGNVMVFLAEGSERAVLERLRAHTREGGRIVIGFRREDTYSYEEFDADLVAAGLRLEQRFGTWHLDPFTDESDFAVNVLRVG